MRYGIVLQVLVLAVAVSVSGAEDPKKLRVGILHVSTETGIRFQEGVVRALESHTLAGDVEWAARPYSGDVDGLRAYQDLVDTGVHLILGPTDSGVFKRAMEDDERRGRVPLVSSQVTADTVIPDDAWFYRTNVGDKRRAQEIARVVGKYWIRSCAVLYADNEFGQRAEVAFRKAMPRRLRANYVPLQYQTGGDRQSLIRQVLDMRAESVGIFGSREEIVQIRQEFRKLNGTAWSYDPLFFSIIDVRLQAADLEGFYFVSLLPDTNTSSNDVDALAEDTTNMTLDLVKTIGVEKVLGTPQTLKAALDDVMRGATEIAPSLTQMAFHDFRNMDSPRVLKIDGGQPTEVQVARVFGLKEKLSFKFAMLYSCFGLKPFINLVLIVAAVLVFNVLDLRRWYRGRLRRLVNIYSLAFVLVNVLLVSLLYIFLAETQKISYDSLLAAAIIAVTPTALLRSTFFDSPAGKAIGLANLYDRLLLWVNDRLATRKFQERQPHVNTLAYYNSLRSLKDRLHQVFSNTRDKDLAEQTRRELDDQIEAAPTHMEKRRVCARRMLRRFEWQRLIAMEMVPREYRTDPPIDPEVIIKKCRTQVSKDPALRQNLDQLIDNLIQEEEARDARRGQSIREDFDDEEKDIYSRLVFLVSRFFYTPEMLVEQGF